MALQDAEGTTSAWVCSPDEGNAIGAFAQGLEVGHVLGVKVPVGLEEHDVEVPLELEIRATLPSNICDGHHGEGGGGTLPHAGATLDKP